MYLCTQNITKEIMGEEFTIRQEGTTLYITLDYELSATNAPVLQEMLKEYEGQDFSKVVFDATELVYISSAGVRVVIFARQKLGEKPEIVFLNGAKEIFDTLDIAGVTNFVSFVEDERMTAQTVASNAEDVEMLKKLNEAKQQQLDYFAANNDVVKYQMKLGTEE